MSEFDPQNLNLTRYQRFVRRFCPERQVMIRADGSIHTLSLKTWHQVLGGAMVVVLFGWMAYSTATLVWLDDIVAAKDARITDARNAYKSLLAQVSVYKAKVAEVTGALKDNHRQFTQLVDPAAMPGTVPAAVPQIPLADVAEPPDDASDGQETGSAGDLARLVAKRRMDRERETLLAQLDTLEQGMSDLSKAHLLLTEFDAIELEMRKVVLQRDLVLAENLEMSARVKELEQNLVEMERAQLMLVDRFGEVAQNSIVAIEENLSGTGLDIDELLDNTDVPSDTPDPQKQGSLSPDAAVAADYGKGGPFLPMDLPEARAEGIETRLATLNSRVSRWTTLRRLAWTLPLAVPLTDEYRITSTFGTRRDPLNGRLARHEGIDLGAPPRTPVYSTAPGKVLFAGWKGGFGRVVDVDHGNGITTRYAHMR
ncbi:MAG: M23 family metallopeptidase, partial [Rhodospirillaceae bacterium]